MIELHPRIVALLRTGFDNAGDGGMDPFTKDQRNEVQRALAPYRTLIDREYDILEAERRNRERERSDRWRATERARLQAELDRLG